MMFNIPFYTFLPLQIIVIKIYAFSLNFSFQDFANTTPNSFT